LDQIRQSGEPFAQSSNALQAAAGFRLLGDRVTPDCHAGLSRAGAKSPDAEGVPERAARGLVVKDVPNHG